MNGQQKDRAVDLIEQLLSEGEKLQIQPGRDLKRLWSVYIARNWFMLLLAAILSACLAGQQAGFALTWRYLFDQALEGGKALADGMNKEHISRIWVYAYCTGGIWLISMLFILARDWLMLNSGRQVVYGLRKHLHEKIQALHIGFFERTPTGKILARIMDDVNVILQWVVQQSINLLTVVLRLIISISMLLYLNSRLALLVIITLPLYTATVVILRPRMRRANIAHRRLMAKLYARAGERINAIPIIKAFICERFESTAFGRHVIEALRVRLKLINYRLLLGLVAGTLTAICFAAMIYIGTHDLRLGRMTIGDLLAFASMLNGVFMPVEQITRLFVRSQEVMVVLRRVFMLIDERVELQSGSIKLEGMKGKVRFDNVTFRYPLQNKPALQNISLKIRSGKKVAIMGPSGSGKSTIFQLLLRFYDPDEGEVRVGGVDVTDADTSSLRNHVCMVQQEPTVFSGTIAENIAYGQLEADADVIEQAARHAELHDFISEQVDGYDTIVGENGITLSGGQRQRLALATALLTEPEILLLDDTTSALDAVTEQKIRQTLNRILKGRTSLIITQRIATARECDNIIVLEEGRIVQQGTHEQLSREEGFYKRICEKQDVV